MKHILYHLLLFIFTSSPFTASAQYFTLSENYLNEINRALGNEEYSNFIIVKDKDTIAYFRLNEKGWQGGYSNNKVEVINYADSIETIESSKDSVFRVKRFTLPGRVKIYEKVYYNYQGISKGTLGDIIESYSPYPNPPQRGLLTTRYSKEGYFVSSIDSCAGRITSSTLDRDTLKYNSIGDSIDFYTWIIGDSSYSEAFSKEGVLVHFIAERGASSNKSSKKWYIREPFESGHFISIEEEDSVYTGLSVIKQSDTIVGKFWETDSKYYDSTWTSSGGWTIEKSIDYDTTLYSKRNSSGELIYQSKFVYKDNQLSAEIVFYPEDSVQTRDFPNSDVVDELEEIRPKYWINGLANSPLESATALWMEENYHSYLDPHLYVFYIREPINKIATSSYFNNEAVENLKEVLNQVDSNSFKVYYDEGIAEIKGNFFEIEAVRRINLSLSRFCNSFRDFL